MGPLYFEIENFPGRDFYRKGCEMAEDYLVHHGILGQKWGIRRYQNPDGSLTDMGKKRYSQTVFVSGSSKTQDKDSEFYRKKLPKGIRKELKESIRNKDTILVGDAPGIDRQVQDYLKSKHYKNVEIYGPGKQVRYSANSKWKTNPIDAPEYEEGSKEWLAKKDIAMTNRADRGLAVTLFEGSKATKNNVKRLIEQNKDVKVFELNGFDKKGDKYVNPYIYEYYKSSVAQGKLNEIKDFDFKRSSEEIKNLKEYANKNDEITSKYNDWELKNRRN